MQPADELTAIENAGGLMLNCADAIALMQDRLSEDHRGKIIEEGTPDQMRESDNPVLFQFLNGSTEGPMLE